MTSTIGLMVMRSKKTLFSGQVRYLNSLFFTIRMFVYFGLWVVIARFYRKHSVRQDETGDVAHTFKMRWWSPLSIWLLRSVMLRRFRLDYGLDPHWFSTMFGVIIFAGSMVSGFATLGLFALWLTKNNTLKIPSPSGISMIVQS